MTKTFSVSVKKLARLMASVTLLGGAMHGASFASDGANLERGGIGLLLNENTHAGSRLKKSGSSDSCDLTLDVNPSLVENRAAGLSELPDLRAAFAQAAGVSSTDAELLFDQWWGAQACQSGQSELTIEGAASPATCRTGESNPVINDIDDYQLVSAFNRLDLADPEGAHCGEYRLVYSHGAQSFNFIIFEAMLPNPTPSKGLAGCAPIANFWASLSFERDNQVVAQRLNTFYTQGIPSANVVPVLRPENLGLSDGSMPTGQIRTNQFIQGPWSFREFAFASDNSALGIRVEQRAVAGTPAVSEFSSNSFASNVIIPQISSLSGDLNTFNLSVPSESFAGESHQNDGNNFSNPVRDLIQDALNQQASSLTATDINNRVNALTCVGCHQGAAGRDIGNELTFPLPAHPFVHASNINDGLGFRLSPALNDVFLPHRQGVMSDYVCDVNLWGSWLDRDQPSGNGDYEIDHSGICAQPADIQVQWNDSGTWQDVDLHNPATIPDDLLRSDATRGVWCVNSEQSDASCEDYRVRFFCPAPVDSSGSLAPVMTGPDASVVSSSDQYSSGYPAWHAFDVEQGGWTLWISKVFKAPATSSIAYTFDQPTVVSSYRLLPQSSWGYKRAPKTWRFEGKINGVWVTVDDRTQSAFPMTSWVSEGNVFSFNNTQAFSEYRFVFTDTNPYQTISLRRIEFF